MALSHGYNFLCISYPCLCTLHLLLCIAISFYIKRLAVWEYPNFRKTAAGIVWFPPNRAFRVSPYSKGLGTSSKLNWFRVKATRKEQKTGAGAVPFSISQIQSQTSSLAHLLKKNFLWLRRFREH